MSNFTFPLSGWPSQACSVGSRAYITDFTTVFVWSRSFNVSLTLPTSRPYGAMACAGSLVLFAGGRVTYSGVVHTDNTVEWLNTTSLTFSKSLPSLSAARYSLVGLAFGHLALFIGGINSGVNLGAVDVFDTRTLKWSVSTSVTPQELASAIAVWPQAVFIAGGVQSAGSGSVARSFTNMTIYSVCAVGQQYLTATFSCQTCSAGFVAPTQGFNCSICPAGYASTSGSSPCSICAPGSFTNQSGSAQCSFCAPGMLSVSRSLSVRDALYVCSLFYV